MLKRLWIAALVVTVMATAMGYGQARVALMDNGQKINEGIGRGVALADFNGDGTLDAFVVNETGFTGSRFRVYFGDGRGRFAEDAAPWEYAARAVKPIVLDANGDGSPDVIAGRIVWLNDGKGHFTADTSRFIDSDGADFWQCRAGDLDKDGRTDVFAIAMVSRGTNAPPDSKGRVYLNDGQGRFKDNGQSLGQGILASVELGDINGDGAPDAVMSGWKNTDADPCPNRIFLNDGQGRFTDSGQAFDEGLNHSHGLALGDLDRDGDLDMVLVTQAAPFARLYLNDGKGRLSAGRTLGTVGVEKVALADLDGNGALDIFLACIGPNEVWLNDGRGGFADSGLRLGSEWSWELAVGDLNGDRLPDLFVVDMGVDRKAPPDKMMQGRFAEIWLSSPRKQSGPSADPDDCSGQSGRIRPSAG
jgi:hypothetical protein